MPLICARRSGQPAARIVGIHYRYRADEQSTTLVLEDQYVADRESVNEDAESSGDG